MVWSAAGRAGARAAGRCRPSRCPKRSRRRKRPRCAVLELKNLTKRFGGNAAVNEVSTTIARGKINAIIGPNGAGKTTLFNLIGGVIKPTSGSMTYEGLDIVPLRTDQVA